VNGSAVNRGVLNIDERLYGYLTKVLGKSRTCVREVQFFYTPLILNNYENN